MAELIVTVSSDVSQAVAGLTSLETRLNGTASAFRDAAPAALLLEGAAAGVGAGLIGATKVAADFEHQMSGVKAVMTPDEVNTFGAALSNLAIVLGRDTVFTSREAAAGIEELIKAGIPAEAVLGGAASAALSLAAATGIGVPQAATIAAQTMNAFGKTASDLSHVVDTLAGTANATAANMSDLQFGLQVVSATAGTMGLSFEDTTAAIGLFVSAGETGATAGTGLRQMLLELIPTTKPAREEMLKLGLTTKDGGNAFFDAAGHVKSLADISGILQKALKGMSDEQRIAALNVLFTRDAINSASILARTGADAVNKLTDSIGQISAADAAKTRLNNLEGALQNLGGSVETVQIIVGNLFLPKLTEIANAVRGVVDRFSQLSPEMQRAIVNFAVVGGVVAALVGGFVLLTPIIGAIGPSFLALAGILAAAAPLFVTLGLAAFGLAAAWRSNFGGLRDSVTGAFDRIGPILGNFVLVFQKAFTGDIGGAADTFLAIVGALFPGVVEVFNNVRTAVSGFIDAFGPIFSNFGGVLQKVLAGDLGGAFDTFRGIVGAVSEPLGGLLGIFQGIGGFVRDVIVPFLGDLAGRIMPALGQVSGELGQLWETKLKGPFETIGGIARDLLVTNFQKLVDALPTLQKASEAMATFWDSKMQPAFQKVGDFIDQNLLKSLADLGTGLGNLSGEKVAAIGAAFSGTLLQSLSAFGNQLQPLVPVFQSVGTFFASVGNVFAAFAELQQKAAPGAPGEDPLTSSLQRLADFVAQNAGLGDRLLLLLPGGTFLQDLADQGPGVAAFFNGLADALNKFAATIRELPPMPDWLQQMIAGNLIGALDPDPGKLGVPGFKGAQVTPTAFTPGGGAGAGEGALISIGTLIVSSEAERRSFFAEMAALLAASTRRVTVPPDNTSNPQLSTGII